MEGTREVARVIERGARGGFASFRMKLIIRCDSHPSYGKYLCQLKDRTLRIDKQAVRGAENFASLRVDSSPRILDIHLRS